MPLRALTYVSNGAVAPASDDDGPAAPPLCFSFGPQNCRHIGTFKSKLLTYVIFGQAELMSVPKLTRRCALT
jgi:hypothetical protein